MFIRPTAPPQVGFLANFAAVVRKLLTTILIIIHVLGGLLLPPLPKQEDRTDYFGHAGIRAASALAWSPFLLFQQLAASFTGEPEEERSETQETGFSAEYSDIIDDGCSLAGLLFRLPAQRQACMNKLPRDAHFEIHTPPPEL